MQTQGRDTYDITGQVLNKGAIYGGIEQDHFFDASCNILHKVFSQIGRRGVRGE